MNRSQRVTGQPGGSGQAIVTACNTAFSFFEQARRRLGRCPVENITTEELRSAIAQNDPPVVLVDVRSRAEQAVSQIPAAITKREYEANRSRFAEHLVVPYCTIGGRSYLLACKLSAAGIKTKNYTPSILGWCQAGLPLETPGGQSTNAVHPYWRILPVPSGYEPKTK